MPAFGPHELEIGPTLRLHQTHIEWLEGWSRRPVVSGKVQSALDPEAPISLAIHSMYSPPREMFCIASFGHSSWFPSLYWVSQCVSLQLEMSLNIYGGVDGYWAVYRE